MVFISAIQKIKNFKLSVLCGKKKKKGGGKEKQSNHVHTRIALSSNLFKY